MKLLRLSLLVLALPLFSLTSCTKDDDNTITLPETDYNYFPLQVGKFVEYQVDSTYWDDFLALKTVHTLQMRYLVADTFTDLSGRISYRVDVSNRKDSTMLWKPESVFYVTQTTNQMEWVQNNLRFVKLVFPVENGRTWNGNEFVSSFDPDLFYFQDWDYRYSDVRQSYNTGYKNYSNTITVNQIDTSVNNPEIHPQDYASRDLGIERYAQGVGLVHKEFTHWIYDPGVRKARKGFSVVMKAFNNN